MIDDLYDVFKCIPNVAKVCIAENVTLKEAGEIVNSQGIPELSSSPEDRVTFSIEGAKS